MAQGRCLRSGCDPTHRRSASGRHRVLFPGGCHERRWQQRPAGRRKGENQAVGDSPVTSLVIPDAKPNRQHSRCQWRSRPSVRTGNDVNISIDTVDDVIDDVTINSPFVPQSDFYNVEESEFGNISTRHSKNKTRHSQYSPLPKMDGNFTHGYVIQDNGSTSRPNVISYSEENETKLSGSFSERRAKKRPLGKSVRQDGPFDYRHTDEDLRAYVSPVPLRTGQYFQDIMPSTHSSEALPSGRSYKAGNALANPSNVIYGQRKY
ncbi:hypothetical protein DPMN_108835 [Dreissena polymorpha]|uniref:Uncharacterized protein n=1 Tax=Dreissena polymorpha TaxID=45954 RepID=A0A9D4QMF9_DREPO|nr:hypothetical protein DPMN_108835 [Dreissena polymorpha]